jgi:hypothetical protein
VQKGIIHFPTNSQAQQQDKAEKKNLAHRDHEPDQATPRPLLAPLPLRRIGREVDITRVCGLPMGRIRSMIARKLSVSSPRLAQAMTIV